MRLARLCTCALLLLLGTGLYAQPAPRATATAASRSEVPPHMRHPRRMPASFTGFAIELTDSERPLDMSYPLFRNFGSIHYDKPARGRYTYLIPLTFKNRKAVDKYLADVIQYRVPEARVVEYYYGRRQDGTDTRRKRRYRFD